MHRNQRTLVALSGTVSDRKIVEYAARFAALGFAKHYHFVHVRPQSPAVDKASQKQELTLYMEELLSNHFAGDRSRTTASCHVLEGDPVDKLIEFSVDQRCDLTIVGHRSGRTGQRRIASRLALVGPGSVLMLPELAPTTISKIMAPVDFSDQSADSVQVAASVAKAAGLEECTLTHVYSDASSIHYDEHQKNLEREERNQFSQFISKIENYGVKLTPFLLEGNKIAESILYAAKEQQSDLIVVNTRGRSKAASILLGSVTSQVLIQSPVAVLAVKHFGAMLNLYQVLRENEFWMKSGPQTN
jgi:nucleotide-binding universal stress UspA family protein